MRHSGISSVVAMAGQRRRGVGGGLIATLSLAFAAGVSPRPAVALPMSSFNVTWLGTLPGAVVSTANDINNAGQVTGTSGTSTTSNNQPFLWSSGSMGPIGTLGGSTGTGNGLSNTGTIVGVAKNGSGADTPFSTVNGTPTAMSLLSGGTSGKASAINSSGVIVGSSNSGSTGQRATLWSSASSTPVNLTPTLGSGSSVANAVNDAGQVVGNLCPGLCQAFAWSAGGGLQQLAMPSLPVLWAVTAGAAAVNASGVIVGYASNQISIYPTIWRSPSAQGELLSMGPFGNPGVLPMDINANGLIVGAAVGANQAVIYDLNGSLINLNSVATGLAGGTLQAANAINDSGQIVGYGLYQGQTTAFLLTPVPEPASAALLGAGLLGLALLRRRAQAAAPGADARL